MSPKPQKEVSETAALHLPVHVPEFKQSNLVGLEELNENGSNYLQWSHDMDGFLYRLGLSKTLVMTESREQLNDHETACVNLCVHYLLAKLSRPLKNIFPRDVTAAQVWNYLEERFKSHIQGAKANLLNAVMNFKIKDNEDIITKITELQGNIARLKGFHMHFTDNEVALRIVQALPSCYHSLKVILYSRQHEISLEEVFNLIHAETFVKGQEEESMMSFKNENALTMSNSKKRVTLRAFKNESRIKRSPKPTDTCKNCGEKGHWAYYKGVKCMKQGNQVSLNVSLANEDNSENSKLFIDSGASKHYTGNEKLLYNIQTVNEEVITANGKVMKVVGVGHMNVLLFIKGKKKETIIKNVYYVPGMVKTLLSIFVWASYGFDSSFSQDKFLLYGHDNSLIAEGVKNGSLYNLNGYPLLPFSQPNNANFSDISASMPMHIWHERFGHLNDKYIKMMNHQELVIGLTIKNESSTVCQTVCEPCRLGKAHKLPFKEGRQRASQPLELIHSDLCGPMDTQTNQGYRYFVTFIDDYTKLVHLSNED